MGVGFHSIIFIQRRGEPGGLARLREKARPRPWRNWGGDPPVPREPPRVIPESREGRSPRKTRGGLVVQAL